MLAEACSVGTALATAADTFQPHSEHCAHANPSRLQASGGTGRWLCHSAQVNYSTPRRYRCRHRAALVAALLHARPRALTSCCETQRGRPQAPHASRSSRDALRGHAL
eukprot:5923117-Prymnesium_polylepis.4